MYLFHFINFIKILKFIYKIKINHILINVKDEIKTLNKVNVNEYKIKSKL